MKKMLFRLCLAFAGFSLSAHTTYYVDAARSDDSGDGVSWATAKKSIQAAIGLVVSNDTIVVTNGTYAPISITNNLPILIRSVNGAAETIIDGDGTNRCATLGSADTHTNTVLTGFTLRNGYVPFGRAGGGSSYGTLNNCTLSGNRAQHIGGGSSDGTLNNCTLSGNTAQNWGGGSCGGTLNNCTLFGNTANSGAGLYGSTLNNCTVSGNTAQNFGGGSHYGTLNNCTLSGNRAKNLGGGSSHSALNNCTVSGNTADGGGSSYYGTLNNCTVSGNTASFDGGGLFYASSTNCIVWGNFVKGVTNNYTASTFSYSCTWPLPVGTGNIAVDPLFVNAGATNLRLRVGSPCINTGLNAGVFGETDLDGNLRILGEVVDMGCYENLLLISQAELVIDPVAPKIYRDVPFQLGTTGGSGTGVVSYLLVSGPGTVSSSGLVTITGAGEIVVQATKAADANYNAVTSTNLTITVNKANQAALTITSPGTKTYGDEPFQLTASGGSGTGTVSYVLVSGPGIVSSSGLVTITRTGNIVVQVTKAADDNYNAVTSENLTITVSASGPTTYYVDAARPDDSGNGQSWATAKKSIQAAIGLVVSDETIVVTNGTYAPISITNNLPILIRSVNGAAETIIDGDGTNRCVTLGTEVSHTNTVLTGFILRNGNADGAAVVVLTQYGGGSCYGTLNNCTLSGNTASSSGGGSCLSMLNNCTLSGNTASVYGGGSCLSTLNNCTLSGNTASVYGGGSYGSMLNNCTLSGNTAQVGGGSFDSTLNNCTLSGNTASFSGGGSYDSMLNNCTLSGNTAQLGGGGSYYTKLNNCIVWGNFVNGATNNHSGSIFSHSCTTPLPSGTGNIAADPLFVNAAATNLRLRVGSPCINTGLNTSVFGETDLDGNPRIIGGQVDMGCYESPFTNQVALVVVAIGSKVYGDAPFQLATTGGNGTGTVSYLRVSGPGTVSSSGWVTITGLGNLVVQATKAGDDNYNSVTSANLSIPVNRSKPTLYIIR